MMQRQLLSIFVAMSGLSGCGVSAPTGMSDANLSAQVLQVFSDGAGVARITGDGTEILYLVFCA